MGDKCKLVKRKGKCIQDCGEKGEREVEMKHCDAEGL